MCTSTDLALEKRSFLPGKRVVTKPLWVLYYCIQVVKTPGGFSLNAFSCGEITSWKSWFGPNVNKGFGCEIAQSSKSILTRLEARFNMTMTNILVRSRQLSFWWFQNTCNSFLEIVLTDLRKPKMIDLTKDFANPLFWKNELSLWNFGSLDFFTGGG